MKWKLTVNANCKRASTIGSTASSMGWPLRLAGLRLGTGRRKGAPRGQDPERSVVRCVAPSTGSADLLGWRGLRWRARTRSTVLLQHLANYGLRQKVDQLDVEDQHRMRRNRPARFIAISKAGFDPEAVFRALG